MGQKVNPIGFRLGNTYTWSSRWYATKSAYSKFVLEDFQLRKLLENKLASAGLVSTIIERSLTSIKVTLHVGRPGVVIGKGGTNLEIVKKDLEKQLNTAKDQKDKVKVDLRVEEVKKTDLSAKLVAERIAQQLAKRFPHRRAVSQAIEKARQAGAKGIKVSLAGRVGGSEIGRTEKYAEGSVPTQTLRAKIDYYHIPAYTRSGYVGVKVWIYTGDSV